MAAPEKLKSIRITSPQKIEELLRKVAISGSPLIIKPNATPGVSVRGRAVPDSENSNGKCLKIANISARGFEHLSKNYEAGFQIEFVLASIKISPNTCGWKFKGLCFYKLLDSWCLWLGYNSILWVFKGFGFPHHGGGYQCWRSIVSFKISCCMPCTQLDKQSWERLVSPAHAAPP